MLFINNLNKIKMYPLNSGIITMEHQPSFNNPPYLNVNFLHKLCKAGHAFTMSVYLLFLYTQIYSPTHEQFRYYIPSHNELREDNKNTPQLSLKTMFL